MFFFSSLDPWHLQYFKLVSSKEANNPDRVLERLNAQNMLDAILSVKTGVQVQGDLPGALNPATRNTADI